MSDRGGDRPPGARGRAVELNALPGTNGVTVDLPVPRTALAVGAHPDDIELSAGATLAKWAARGCQVHMLVLTDGSKGTWDPDRDPVSLVAARQDEQREAAGRLGSNDVGFFGWPDGELRNGVHEQWEVCRWIRTVRPDVVLGHDPWRRYRLHPDHRHAGFVLTDAIVAARDPLFFPDQGVAPHRPDALLLWEPDVPNHVEDASGFVDVKVHALLAHRSQFETTFGLDPAAALEDREPGCAPARAAHELTAGITAKLAEHGRIGGIELGECFHLIDDL